MKIKILCLSAIFALSTTVCGAETVYLKNGRTIEGTITERNDNLIKVSVAGIVLTFYKDEIARIEGESSPPVRIPTPIGTQESASAPSISAQKQLPSRTYKSYQPSLSQASPSQGSAAADMSASKEELIVALIEASGAKDNMIRSFNQMMSQASPDEAALLRQVLDIDEIISAIIPVYDKYFTKQEVKELINFYQSPIGKKLLTTTPQVMQESAEATMQLLQKKVDTVTAK